MLGLSNIDLGNPVADHPLNRGLVAWWNPLAMGGSGVSAREVKGGRAGVLTNGASWRPGPYGYSAMSFDGTNDYMVGPQTSLFIPSTGLTFACLFRTSTNDRFLVDNASSSGTQGWAVRGSAAPGLFFHVNGTVTPSGTSIIDGLWYFGAWTWVPSVSVTSYLNGRQDTQNTTSIPSSIIDPGVPFWLGQRRSGGDYWSGSIGDVRVYGRALAASEVRALYDQVRLGHSETLRRFSRRAWLFGGQVAGGGGVTQEGAASLSCLLGGWHSGRLMAAGSGGGPCPSSVAAVGALAGVGAARPTVSAARATSGVLAASSAAACPTSVSVGSSSSSAAMFRLARCIDLGNPVADHPLNRGLAAWWLPLPNNAGGLKMFDIKGGNHMALTNAPTWVAGPNGMPAVSLNGTSQDMRTLGWNDPRTNFTWNVVFRSGTSSATQVIMAGVIDGTYRDQLFYHSSGRLALTMSPSGANPINVAWTQDPNKFFLVTLTRSGSDWAVYRDGILLGTGSNATASAVGLRSTFFGFELFTYMAGQFAWGSVYSRALSASEVYNLYEQSRKGFPDTLRRLSVGPFTVQGLRSGVRSASLACGNAGLTAPASLGANSSRGAAGVASPVVRLGSGASSRRLASGAAVLDGGCGAVASGGLLFAGSASGGLLVVLREVPAGVSAAGRQMSSAVLGTLASGRAGACGASAPTAAALIELLTLVASHGFAPVSLAPGVTTAASARLTASGRASTDAGFGPIVGAAGCSMASGRQVVSASSGATAIGGVGGVGRSAPTPAATAGLLALVASNGFARVSVVPGAAASASLTASGLSFAGGGLVVGAVGGLTRFGESSVGATVGVVASGRRSAGGVLLGTVSATGLAVGRLVIGGLVAARPELVVVWNPVTLDGFVVPRETLEAELELSGVVRADLGLGRLREMVLTLGRLLPEDLTI